MSNTSFRWCMTRHESDSRSFSMCWLRSYLKNALSSNRLRNRQENRTVWWNPWLRLHTDICHVLLISIQCLSISCVPLLSQRVMHLSALDGKYSMTVRALHEQVPSHLWPQSRNIHSYQTKSVQGSWRWQLPCQALTINQLNVQQISASCSYHSDSGIT